MSRAFLILSLAAWIAGCGGNQGKDGDAGLGGAADLASSVGGDLGVGAQGRDLATTPRDLGSTQAGDLATAPGDLATAPADLGSAATSFARDVKPILTQHGCFAHHMSGAWDGVESVTQDDGIVAYLTGHTAAECGGTPSFVKAGDAAASFLYQKIAGVFAASCGAMTGARMPPAGALTAAQIATVKAWIDEGAPAN